MSLTGAALIADAGREAMTPDDASASADAICETVTITLRSVTHVLAPGPDETIVQAAYRLGVRPPVSCLSGSCGTCLARLTGGSVAMRANDVLTADEIARGYVLTCQAVPTARAVAVDYDDG